MFTNPEKKSIPQSFRKRRWTYLLVAVVSLAMFFGFLEYPKVWDKTADFLNEKLSLDNYGVKIPHIWKIPFHLAFDI
jgi:hypothetical protein